jgi:hypothetical protein
MQNQQQPAISYSQAAAAGTTTTPKGNNSDLRNMMGHFLNEFKSMFSQLLNQNSMIISMLTTMISKFSH